MISLASDLTDGKGRHARAWLFFDAECEFCTVVATRIAKLMRRRGLDVAPLQDPRVGPLLGLTRAELLQAFRFVSTAGRQYAGADAVIALARELWWAQPLAWLAAFPGMMRILRAGYQWIADHRGCPGRNCEIVAGPAQADPQRKEGLRSGSQGTDVRSE